jgi:hypothetical protein
MASQTDLDQGGTARQWVRTYLGPSVGWVYLPGRNPFVITVAGTYVLTPDTSLVEVNVAGLVTLTLPTAIDPGPPAGALPGLYAKTPITIVDLGGNALAFPITINPASVAENIMGLSTPPVLQITSNYGAYTLEPSNAQKGWTQK